MLSALEFRGSCGGGVEEILHQLGPRKMMQLVVHRLC